MMQYIFGLFLLQSTFEMLGAISPASLLQKSTGLESVEEELVDESVMETEGQRFCVSLSDCSALGWQIAWRSGSYREWRQRRRSLNSHVILGYADSAGKLHHAWYFKTPTRWAKGLHPYRIYLDKVPNLKVTNVEDGRTFVGELVTSSYTSTSDFRSLRSLLVGGCECSDQQQIGGKICLRKTAPASGSWQCGNAGDRVPIDIDFPYIKGWKANHVGVLCGTSGLSHYHYTSGPNLCLQYGAMSVVILTGPKPAAPTTAAPAPPTDYPTRPPSSGSPLCSTLTTCGSAGWTEAWRSDDSKIWSTALQTHVMLGYVDTSGQLHHAWYFPTPLSWMNTHPYDLDYDVALLTATRAADGKTYTGQLVSSKWNYHGACECGRGHGGHWGRVCLRKASPIHGRWTCGYGQNRVPADIDFPYLRGFDLGNGCGHSSLSHYNWNEGEIMCSQYLGSKYGRKSAIIMTGTFSR